MYYVNRLLRVYFYTFCHRIAESCVIIDFVLSFQIRKYIMSKDELYIKILHYEVSSSFDESDYLFFV